MGFGNVDYVFRIDGYLRLSSGKIDVYFGKKLCESVKVWKSAVNSNVYFSPKAALRDFAFRINP